MQVLHSAGTFAVPEGESRRYHEHLRVPALSVGTYCIPADGVDGQQPHTEDEVYVVASGRARFVTDSDDVEVGPGSVLYVPAAETHRFTDVSEDLSVVVVFAPAQGTQA